jgi:hypothetical protein
VLLLTAFTRQMLAIDMLLSSWLVQFAILLADVFAFSAVISP